MEDTTKPTNLNDKDRLEVLLAAEQIRYQQTLVQLTQLRLDEKIYKESILLSRIRDQYQLGLNDTFDPETGLITRN